jgi:SNF2-related domain/Helicase conserved C-terminal domain
MLFSADHNLIVYDNGDAEIAARAVPDAIVKGNYAVVKATYPNLLKLNEADLDVPDPMATYEWPCQPGTEPFPTQKLVSSFMVLNPRSFIVSALRTGKTRSALWAVDWLMSRSATKIRCLVLSDIAALDKTWATEIFTHFLGRRSYEMLYGSAAAREQALARDADFYLLNHDALRIGQPRRIVTTGNDGRPRAEHVPATGLYKALLAKKFDVVIFDEAATYREHTTRMSAAARDISAHAAYVWLMTGTPTPNGPLDAYGLKKLCHPHHRLSYTTWRDTVTEPDGPFRRRPRPNAVEEVDALLHPSIRISQEQCFEPTSLKTIDLQVPLSEEQKELIRELKRELTLMLESGAEITAVNEAALRAKLIQISCGAVYDAEHNAHLVDAYPRLDKFKELCRRIPGKIIVFAPLTSILAMLWRELGDTASLIDNTMSRSRKLETLRNWQHDPSKKVILSHPGPVARGVDLSEANVVLWYAPTDRTEYYVQANERINGINQRLPRYIIKMYSSPIERDIYARLEENIHMQGLILKLKELYI